MLMLISILMLLVISISMVSIYNVMGDGLAIDAVDVDLDGLNVDLDGC